MAIILGLLKAFAALPVLESIFDEFSAWYVERRISAMKAENADAIRKAITDHDQRPIEHAIGSSLEGQLSGDPGTIVIDHLPGGLP